MKKYNVDLLYNTVFNTLKTAEELKYASVAIPAISSGIFGFPKPLCAETFFTAIRDSLPNSNLKSSTTSA